MALARDPREALSLSFFLWGGGLPDPGSLTLEGWNPRLLVVRMSGSPPKQVARLETSCTFPRVGDKVHGPCFNG